MRKNLIIIFWLLFTLSAFCALTFSQTTYYVKTGGNDAAAGTSDATAWGSVTKVNSFQSSLSPGDSILFKRGDAFSGTITIGKGGTTDTTRIVYSAYGTGAKPIFTGLTTISGWTSQGDSIWYKDISAQSNPNYIIIDGKWYAMGRYPNTTWLSYESFSTNVSITDNQLTHTPNWTGAEAVIKKSDYRVPRTQITNHTNSTITYTSYGTTINPEAINFGYFFQNDMKTLDVFGEWYYNGTRLYVYFGSEDTADHVVKIPVINSFILNHSNSGGPYYSYTTIDNLSFIGAGKSAISYSRFTDYHKIQNCDFKFSGENAVEFGKNLTGAEVGGVRYALIDNNTINYSAKAGIWAKSDLELTITNNTIKNSGVLLGADNSATEASGMHVKGNDSMLVQYNMIDSSGYNGLHFTGHGAKVKNNYITNSLRIFNDGAGIYTEGKAFTLREITDNIIIGTYGDLGGTPTPRRSRCIYLDVSSCDVLITGNTVSEAGDFGFFQGGGNNVDYYNNTSYNNNTGSIFFQSYASYSDGLAVTLTNMKYNQFIAKGQDEINVRVQMFDVDVPLAFTVSDSNYYARPIDDAGDKFRTNSGHINFTEWKTLSAQDDSSKQAPYNLATVNDFLFWYNPTQEDSIIALDTTYRDINNVSFVTADTLGPYASRVLMIGDTDEPPNKPTVETYNLVKVTLKKVYISGNVSSDGGGTISARGICFSTVGSPSVADSVISVSGTEGMFTVRIDNLAPLTTYYFRAFATNQKGPEYGRMYAITTPEYNIFKDNSGRVLFINGRPVTYD